LWTTYRLYEEQKAARNYSSFNIMFCLYFLCFHMFVCLKVAVVPWSTNDTRIIINIRITATFSSQQEIIFILLSRS